MSHTQNQTKEQEIAEVKKHIRQHILIAIGLVIGTLVAIGVTQMQFQNSGLKIAVALAIACTQAFFIIAFFMGLISEKKIIFSFLAFTAIFFVVQMGVTIWARSHDNEVQIK